MSIPECPVNMDLYKSTLVDYKESAGEFDVAMGERDEAYEAMIEAQDIFNTANEKANVAAAKASEDLTRHTNAAKEVGVEPLAASPKKR
jgi:hypothetical protein